MGGGKIVIVKKKKVAHHGHHGGSWKVAYADFVTAMMAFFLVMWIMSMDQGVKDLVQGYFQNPVGFKRSFSGGQNLLSAGNFITDLEVKRTLIINRRQQERRFEELGGRIEAELTASGLIGELGAEVEIVVTEEGLRIELMEGGDGEDGFFDVASAQLKPRLRRILQVVGLGLLDVPGEVVVEGHTDALAFGGRIRSNWELSAERANAARRELEAAGLSADRIAEVRGYADRRLKVPERPSDPHNRRITVLLPFVEAALDDLNLDGLDLQSLLRSAAARRAAGGSGP